jgi:Carboxypeptidase regulatory-like domain
MSRNLRVAIAVGVMAIAAVGWWLRGHRSAAPAPSQSPAAAASAAGRAERPQRGEPGELPRVMIDDDPPGTLRLEGQVVDADDHGVGGATVVITSNPARSTSTEADGSFAFDGLVARPYTLIARAAKGVAGPITARLTEKSEPVVLRLRPAARLTVVVVGRDGKPISGATVELRGVDVQLATTTGAPAVFAPVVPGGYQIAAWADGMAHAFQRIQIGKGDAQARLMLSSGAPVTGRVVDDRGTGLAGAHVRFSGASDWTQQASERFDAAITGADGSFRFEAMPAGSFRFLASHPERAPGSSTLVTLDGKTPLDGVVIALEVGAVVKGRVVDAQHQPVASARVRIGVGGPGGPGGTGRRGRSRGGPGGPGRMFEPPRQAYSDASGAFEIRGLPRSELTAVAMHETGASDAVDIDATSGEVNNVVLTLDVTGTIAGAVVDPDGQPVEGAQVTAGPDFSGFGGGAGSGSGALPAFNLAQLRLRGLPEDVTDAGGRFTLTGLTAGQYRLTASPSTRTGRRGGFRDGVLATTGDRNVKLVVQPDGAVKGKVAFADGGSPDLFTVSIQQNEQSFLGNNGAFLLDGIAPGSYQLAVRGPGFQSTAVSVTIAASTTADAGTITVVKGRTIAGIVVADGQPVPDATVYAGRQIFGNGTTSAPLGGQGGPLAAQFGGGTKTTTTDASGAFSLSGFGDGDLTVVAEQPALGRSRALRLPTVMPGQTELTLALEKYGSLSGTVRQGARPAAGTAVTAMATATPGAVYTVVAGSDGAYRFDQLAPDAYKVSATVGNPRSGLRFYSQQIDVPMGNQVRLDLSVDPGTVTVDVAITAKSGAVGVATAWLISGAITASSASDLALAIAAAGAGNSLRVVTFGGAPAVFTQVAPGSYSACVTPLPAEVSPGAARGYADRHSDTLGSFCQPVVVAASPDSQSAQVAVVLPPFIADPGTGGGSGSGGGSGGGRARSPAHQPPATSHQPPG